MQKTDSAIRILLYNLLVKANYMNNTFLFAEIREEGLLKMMELFYILIVVVFIELNEFVKIYRNSN